MWQVIETKSDAEPWWFFDGWEKDIVNQWAFESRDEAFKKYLSLIKENIQVYPKVKAKNLNPVAFWNPEESVFCEACDDDLQLYHGYILMGEGQTVDLLMHSTYTDEINGLLNNA